MSRPSRRVSNHIAPQVKVSSICLPPSLNVSFETRYFEDVALVSPKTEVLTTGYDDGMVLESNPKQQHCKLLGDQTSAKNHFATKLHVSASPENHRTQALDRGQPGEINSSRQMSTVDSLR